MGYVFESLDFVNYEVCYYSFYIIAVIVNIVNYLLFIYFYYMRELIKE